MQEINLTQLARQHHATTKDIEKRLRSKGVEPVQEVHMPSGRRFMVWDAKAAQGALEQWVDKRRTRTARPKQEQAAVEAASTAEIAEIKQLLAQILEHLTKPKH